MMDIRIGTEYSLTDALGSIIALTDENGVVKTRYNYTPFGAPETIGEASDNPFMFTGREWDGATGLYYYRARYYSPTMGRFISEDPIGLAGGINMYAYTSNSPVNFVDPIGLEFFMMSPGMTEVEARLTESAKWVETRKPRIVKTKWHKIRTNPPKDNIEAGLHPGRYSCQYRRHVITDEFGYYSYADGLFRSEDIEKTRTEVELKWVAGKMVPVESFMWVGCCDPPRE